MKRILPGFLLAGCWLLLLLSGTSSLFWLVIIILACIGAYEYLQMVTPVQGGEAKNFTLSLALALPVVFAGLWHFEGVCAGLFLAALMAMAYVLCHYASLENSFEVMSRLFFGIVYIGFFSAHLVLLRLLPEGNLWLIILVAITAGSDSGAYYVGKSFGKRKLCPSISPNKTIEGALGGLVCGVGVAVVCALFLLESINWKVLIPVAIILTGVGIVGDLCESVVKRGTDTKDSGRILLGHGGVLDRIDSLILAAPFLYYLQVFAGRL